MVITRALERWIEEQEKQPLSKDYKKAVEDFKKILAHIENEIHKDNGDIEIEIAGVGDFGFSGYSGPASYGFGQMVDYIDRRTRNNKEHKGKFLVEVKGRKLDPYERFRRIGE